MSLSDQEFNRLKNLIGERQNPNLSTMGNGGGYSLGELGGDIRDTFLKTGETLFKAGENVVSSYQKSQSGERNPVLAGFDIAGNVAGGVLGAAGDVIMGAGKLAISQESEDEVKNKLIEAITPIAKSKEVQSLIEGYKNLDENTKQNLRTTGNIGMALVDILTLGGAKVVGKAGKEIIEEGVESGMKAIGGNVIKGTIQQIPTEAISEFGKGAVESAKQLGRRVARGTINVVENTIEKGKQASLNKTLTTPEKSLVDLGVDETIRNFVKGSDKPTVSTYKQMIQSAKNAEGTIADITKPIELAGKSFVDTYQVLDNQRKVVGKQIGSAIQKLGNTTKVDVSQDVGGFLNSLKNTGVKVVQDKTGKISLNFKGTSFTPTQRNAIKNLVQLTREGGSKLTPLQIWRKDNLFSKFKREITDQKIDALNYTKSDGSMGNLIDDARAVFNNKLETISPEFKKLNPKYARLAQIKENVEKNIFKVKRGAISDKVSFDKFTKDAGISLSQILGKSAQTPKLNRLVDIIETEAKKLGYKGASAKNATIFARELEDIFKIAPKTGFQGEIRSAIQQRAGGLIDRTVSALDELSAPTKKQIQDALEQFIDDLNK